MYGPMLNEEDNTSVIYMYLTNANLPLLHPHRTPQYFKLTYTVSYSIVGRQLFPNTQTYIYDNWSTNPLQSHTQANNVDEQIIGIR